MPTPQELEARLWKALRSDMTVMLGLANRQDHLLRPMTVQIDGEANHGPLWIFSARDTELVEALSGDDDAFISFAGTSKARTTPSWRCCASMSRRRRSGRTSGA